MIELRYVGEFDKRLQMRRQIEQTDLKKYLDGEPAWGPWEDVPTVPSGSDKLPDKE